MKPLTELYFKVLLENIRIGFEVTDGDKHASLLQYRIDSDVETLYSSSRRT